MTKELKIVYECWEAIVNQNNFSTYYIRHGDDIVEAWTGNKEYMYVCDVDADIYGHWTGSFSASATQTSSSHDAQALIVGMDVPKKQRIQVDPRHGTVFEEISINWCDKSSWWYASQKITNEVFDHVSGNIKFQSPTASVCVDVTHGRVTGERHLRASHAPTVLISSSLGIEIQTEHSPETTDAHYSFDYASASVEFLAEVDPTASVVVTYHKVTSSLWRVEPPPGKQMELMATEINFSKDIGLTDTAVFMPYGVIDAFAPHLVSETPNYITSFPSGFVIPLSTEAHYYDTFDDYVNQSQRLYPALPQLGGNTWRGTKGEQYILRWPYNEEASRVLKSSLKMRFDMYLENGIEFSGSKAIAAVYAVVGDEE